MVPVVLLLIFQLFHVAFQFVLIKAGVIEENSWAPLAGELWNNVVAISHMDSQLF